MEEATTAQVSGGAEALAARAQQISQLLDPIAQRMRTTSVISTLQGQSVVSSGGVDLSRVQRLALSANEIAARAPGLHAEVTGIATTLDQGLTPTAIGIAGGPGAFCPACASYLEEFGATISSPTTAEWLGPK